MAAAVPAMFVVPAISSAQPPICSAEMLNATTQQDGPPSSNGQNMLRIVLTNTSPQTCLVQGHPGVDLTGPDHPTFGPTYSLPRQEAGFAPVTVAPGAAVSSELTYLADGPQGWTPTMIVVTPPDTTTQLQVPWPQAGSVSRQDAATHPGTYIGPLRPA
ncbi:DUF4232 domain-containing protein [Nocardia australiensis]|uniref:DUF4232 domain-containing protein n=1 Tax=Nocardia australiensis TaxID=2887191 RepID=UPI001D15ABB2|nr:DUF4232 domain-containing protein [Nocardia australiensis]